MTDLITEGEVLWPLADHLGTLRDLATYDDVAGASTIANHRQYDSFGNLISETNAAIDELFGFTGRLFDESTHLQYNLNRWYDPSTARWLTEDPISFAAGDTNLSRYVSNNPLTFTDPSGLAPPGTTADIINDLDRDGDAGMRANLKARSDTFCEGIQIAQDGQRVMADLAGAGALVDGAEAISGRDAFSGRPLSTGERVKAGLWAAFGMFTVLDSVDDGARAGSRASRSRSTASVARGAPPIPRVPFFKPFSNPKFGREMHAKFSKELCKRTGTRPSDWQMRTAPGLTGVDARYVGEKNIGFEYAELKPYTEDGYNQFKWQVENWNLPPGQTQFWGYDPDGGIFNTGVTW